MSSNSTGPNTKINMAGKMSTPVGTIIFTGAFAMRSSRCALQAFLTWMLSASNPSTKEVPNRNDRIHASTTRTKTPES